MTGKLERKAPLHNCEVGVVKERVGWPGQFRKVRPLVSHGDEWICDDCGAIWIYNDRGGAGGRWSRTLLKRSRW